MVELVRILSNKLGRLGSIESVRSILEQYGCLLSGYLGGLSSAEAILPSSLVIFCFEWVIVGDILDFLSHSG